MSTAGALAACATLASSATTASGEREDCPGKIICPVTGALICADECPVTAGMAAPPLAPAPGRACCSGARF